MNQIKIDCPSCSGHGKYVPLGTKCTYCGGRKKVKLTYHLKVIGHLQELRNVADFQRRTQSNTM